ncbi:related to Glutamate--tRNA ligase, mitochondrial [Saccharomycodes ludwigii]|uniref:Glutamate--tRNA ligase, mitochondrial n=1 Tax=Saccharomycodes ludwigii TaxID=36035 RepID=A0A376B7Z8_9ASCO|nr:related to Glutamate--tRNA ligase, mitochondrial [Saccharomycodes ludwigii]
MLKHKALSRFYSTKKITKSILTNNTKSIFSKKPIIDVHPKTPARTRFAPSPTGFLHMGSLRTALYNYLLAKNTGGQFLLRLEDTDQNRLVKGAEQNIYDSLRWCNLEYDEGPEKNNNTEMGPYRQSDRSKIYQEHAQKLLDTGHAYRCFCSKERLDGLRESAQRLKPPTTVSYDRKCAHLHEKDIQNLLKEGKEFTIRLRSPAKYPPFEDLLHGKLDMQPQVNPSEIRYDDPILLKSDGLPTYHLANVVDDHMMKITHVIRGEEWLPSTPKHMALYEAFGWNAPKFIHIPLLTTIAEKKLSKRKGDASVMALQKKGILPEALINFSALFGWSPPRKLSIEKHDCFSLEELVKLFNLNHLTKGNAKVDEKKLFFFNKHYLGLRLDDPIKFQEIVEDISNLMNNKYPKEKIGGVLNVVGKSLTTINEFPVNFYYFFEKPDFDSEQVLHFKKNHDLEKVKLILAEFKQLDLENVERIVDHLVNTLNVPKKLVFESLRFALAGSMPGTKLPILIQLLGKQEVMFRTQEALDHLS